MSNDLVIVMCPPLSDYKEAPKDQSHSELFDCPKCKDKMWLSEKKKGMLAFASYINKEIILACYHCITKMAQEQPELFTESKRVDL
jgi:hypothetical protein